MILRARVVLLSQATICNNNILLLNDKTCRGEMENFMQRARWRGKIILDIAVLHNIVHRSCLFLLGYSHNIFAFLYWILFTQILQSFDITATECRYSHRISNNIIGLPLH